MSSSTRREIPAADVVVVGSGATGGWAAKVLGEAGLDVIVVEAGRSLDPARDRCHVDYWQYRPDNYSEPVLPALFARQPVQRQHPMCTPRNHHFFVDDHDNPFTTEKEQPFVWIRGRQQGGRSMVWGGQTWRLSPYELDPVVPAGVEIQPWPLTYTELAPYYDEVEAFLGVSGNRDGLAEVPDGVFSPAAPLSAAESEFCGFARTRYGRAVITTRAILPDRQPEPQDDGASWPRFSSPGSTLASAMATGRVRLVTDAPVCRVRIDRESGRATGVECLDSASLTRFSVPARAVVLCASTIESVRILLASHPDGDPAGLGNSSGVLGRYLADHCHGVLFGLIPERLRDNDSPPLEAWNGYGLYIPRFRNRAHQETDYYGGFGVMMLMQRKGLWPRAESLDHEQGVDGCGAGIFGEVLPRRESRISLDPMVRDRWGIPAAHVDYRYTDNEARLLDDGMRTIRDMMVEFGCDIVHEDRSAPPGYTIHVVGGARMGKSRNESYLDSECRSWDVPNLLVTDGAAWPTSAYQNPTLTMMALTIRACQQLARRIRRNDV